MSTINTHYTFNYSQPEEYKLSHDSVFFARSVFERTKSIDLKNARILDVCAGSGVIGMDFLFHRRSHQVSQPHTLDFLEIQNIYQDYFIENCKRLGKVNTQLNFINRNYDDLQTEEFNGVYDLILGNPPYFLKSQGKLSPNEFKNRCRFFIDSDLTSLLQGIACSLKKGGEAYLLLRDQLAHGYNVIEQARVITSKVLEVEIVGDIRGTHLTRFVHC